jgi:hypothetical protein
MKCVILAGGYGTRISEESHLKPKPMVEIARKVSTGRVTRASFWPRDYHGHDKPQLDFVAQRPGELPDVGRS